MKKPEEHEGWEEGTHLFFSELGKIFPERHDGLNSVRLERRRKEKRKGELGRSQPIACSSFFRFCCPFELASLRKVRNRRM